MKAIIILLLISCFAGTVSAQQTTTTTTADAQLLEYYQTQRYAEAAEYLKASYPERVTDNKIISALAYTSLMAGKTADAETYYLRILAADSLNTAVLSSLGNVSIRRGNSAKARNYYKKILAVDSTNFNVYKQLANLSQGLDNMEETIFYLQKANKLNPAESEVAFDLSAIYISLKQVPLADKVISAALAADSANVMLILGKAKVNYQLDKYAETIRLCNKLLAEEVKSYDVIKMLGASYYNTKNYTACIETFKLLDENNSQNEASWYYMAISYKALGSYSKAISCLRESIKEGISPNIDSYYSEIADSFDKLGKVKNSAESYKKALQFDQKPMTYYALAGLYDAKMKDTAAAIRYYKKYIESRPPAKQQNYKDYAADRIIRLKR